jgi:hypothetical protein
MCREVWQTEFLPLAAKDARPEEPDTFLNDMMGIEVATDEDEFSSYAHRSPTAIDDPKTFNPIKWWHEHQTSFLTLHLCVRYSCNTRDVS